MDDGGNPGPEKVEKESNKTKCTPYTTGRGKDITNVRCAYDKQFQPTDMNAILPENLENFEPFLSKINEDSIQSCLKNKHYKTEVL